MRSLWAEFPKTDTLELERVWQFSPKAKLAFLLPSELFIFGPTPLAATIQTLFLRNMSW